MDGPEDFAVDQPLRQSSYPEVNAVPNLPCRSSRSQARNVVSARFDQYNSETSPDDDELRGLHRRKRQKLLDKAILDSDDPDYQSSQESSMSDSEMLDGAEWHLEDNLGPSSVATVRRGRRLDSYFGRSRGLGSRGSKAIRRGPKRALEPSPEFKLLQSDATSAFIDGDYERAIVLVKQAIQINPEMFVAHSLLSEIFLAQGFKDKALAALFSGAHTRPKDPSVWLKVAKLILERAGEDRASALQDAAYCYSRVIEIDQKNHATRFQRAAIYRELGYNGKAIQEYERILKDLPHNTRALRHLAEAYIDLNDVDKARARYEESIAYYTSLPLEEATDFTWSDVNIYIELFSYSNKYKQGILSLRSLARWLLGRKDEVEWDSIQQDDREWDADDFSRRIDTTWFRPGTFPIESYGLGLPLELRVKLGIYRLKMGPKYREEALAHLSWLDPEDRSPGAKVFDYGDLFREAADALKDAGFHEDAIRFYRPLQQTDGYADTTFFMALGECYVACQNDEEAENCYLTVIEYDDDNIEARAKLAKIYERLGMIEPALKYVNEAVQLGRRESMPQRRRRAGSRAERLAQEFRSAESAGIAMTPDNCLVSVREGALESPSPRVSTPVTLTTPTTARLSKSRKGGAGKDDETEGGDHVQYLYSKLLELRPDMRDGKADATEDWLDIADALLRDFRSNRVFFPLQRHMLFLGYSREAQRKAGKLKTRTLMDEVQEMAGRLQASLGTPDIDPSSIPTDYHGISFDDWLDIFLEYSLIMAGQGQSEATYDTLSAAADASIWYHSKQSTCRIYTCWFTCAIRLKDEETLANIARWFMKEYQFVTDTYRLFAALSRLCGDPRKSLFHSSPSMKFMLRQIKAIDYTLPPDPSRSTPIHRTRASIFQERATLTTKDASGEPIPAEEMDVALLVLYGHILYAGSSFTNALNYFFRAYALDPDNPAVLLSIGLSYIHHSLKRQSDNRHYLIMQGLAFMQEYRRVREWSKIPQERQEMEFNFARVWHMLGLAHLAVQGYKRCLELSEEIVREGEVQSRHQENQHINHDAVGKEVWVEDFSREAAYALQCLYTISGETMLAKDITERWLVI